MKKIHNYKELYNEILKSFYLGSFNKNDRYMTQIETKAFYGVARNSVEKVFKMLQQEGFLYSDGNRGTVVTFDRNNPQHVEKVPLYHHNPKVREFNTFSLPIMMLSGSLYEGLRHSNEEQLQGYCEDVEEIIRCMEQNCSYHVKVVNLHLRIVADTGNFYLTAIMEHFLSRYLYFNIPKNLTAENRVKIKEYIWDFYISLMDVIKRRDFLSIIQLVQEYYGAVYQIPDALLFSVVEEDAKIFQEQSLYVKLLHTLLFSIHTNRLKKGDFLPTIAELRKSYHVSEKTVRNAYDVLAQIGLVDRKQRVGTRLIADPGDRKINNWTAKRFSEQKGGLQQMLEALLILGAYILRITADSLSPDVIREMENKLDEQHNDNTQNHLPYCVADALITPVVMSQQIGVLQKYYFYVLHPAAELVSVCGLENEYGLKNSDEIYRSVRIALESLKSEDYEQFIFYTIQAQQLNSNLLMEACDTRISSWVLID